MGARIKAGLALSEKHIGICDFCRERFRLGSRNDFVEKAIEHYQDYLMSEEQLSGLSQEVVYTLNRQLSRYTDTVLENQKEILRALSAIYATIKNQIG